MKKKALTLGMAVFMGLNLMSCGGSNSMERAADALKTEAASASQNVTTTKAAEEIKPSGEEQTSAETEMTSETEAPASDAGAEEVDATALRDYKFSEGLAWVMQDGNPAVVDSDGMIRFVVDVSEAKAAGAHTPRTTPFVDGASALYDEYGVSDKGFGGFEIYDSEGNVLFDSEDGDDTTELNILAAGDGYYLIGKSVESMAVSENTIYVIDKNGNVLVPEHQVQYFDSFTYAGDGAFASTAFGASSILIDTNNKTVYDSNTVEFDSEDYWKTEAGTMVMAHGNGETMAVGGHGVYSKKTGFMSEFAPVYWNKSFFLYDTPYDSVARLTPGWYDAEGNLVIAAPEFPEGVYYIVLGNFVGDYAPIGLEGVDGNSYVTIVDKTGATLYEPVKVERIGSLSSDKNGTVCSAESRGSNDYYVLKDGTLIHLGEDEMSSLPEDTSFSFIDSTTALLNVVNEGIYVASDYAGNGKYNSLQYVRLNGEVIKIMLPKNAPTIKCAAIKKQ